MSAAKGTARSCPGTQFSLNDLRIAVHGLPLGMPPSAGHPGTSQ